MSEPDVQHFDTSGTWVKPPGAVLVEVTLRGGDGEPGGPGLRGGAGGCVTIAGDLWAAGGGGGGGTLVPGAPGGPGGEGETVRYSFAAGSLPDELAVTAGRTGGYAHFITYREAPGDYPG